MKTWKLIIKGKVQGVFYRASARDKAVALNLTGTARNREDGNVEIYVSGEQADLEIFLQWCKQGPAEAEVSEVEKEETTHQDFPGFRILR